MPNHPLRLICTTLALAIVAMAATVHAADFQRPAAPGRLFRVVNASFDSVVGMEVADASASGDASYASINLGEPLQGGLSSATVRLPEGACHRNLRATFRDGRREVYRDVDVCQATGLKLSPLKRLPQGAGLPATH
jgi:hypothetical protein